MDLSRIYEGNYKKYLIAPIILYIVFALAILQFPGIKGGIDLQGGTRLIVRADMESGSQQIDSKVLESLLDSRYELEDLQINSTSSPGKTGATIQFLRNKAFSDAEAELTKANLLLREKPEEAKAHARNAVELLSKTVQAQYSDDAEEMVSLANDALVKAKEGFQQELRELLRTEFSLSGSISTEQKEISPILGKAFWANAMFVALAAMLFLIAVIFIVFRKLIPSLAVIAAAVFDILGALALMAVFGVPLSLVSIPPLLMLVGYSVDTDILLTTRVIMRKEGTAARRAWSSFITGTTMTTTTMVALAVMLALSYFMQISVIFEISAVLLFGLIADLVSTWMMNAPILLWYAEKKERKIR